MNDPALRAYRWLDLQALAREIAGGKSLITAVHFFTAFYPGEPQKRQRHEDYLDALRLRGVTPVIGTFRRKEKYCRACKQVSVGYEEKETDVNIAVSLFKFACLDAYDKALLLSGDSDLLPAIRAVREVYPEKQVQVVFPPGHRYTHALRQAAHSCIRINNGHLLRNQLPDPVIGGGRIIRKPQSWQ